MPATRIVPAMLAALLALLATAWGVSPAAAAARFEWTAVASGGSHTCALSAEGVVYCWGDNSQGQVGQPLPPAPDPAVTPAPAPVPVPPVPSPTPVGGPLAGQTVVAIAAGGSHSCAVTSSGKVYCWGAGGAGQRGDGTKATAEGQVIASSTPVEVVGPLSTMPVVSIAAGASNTCALTQTGAAYCWGDNSQGQLGIGVVGAPSATPVAVNASGALAGVRLTGIAVGDSHVCAADAAGAAWCWGNNAHGQSGSGVPHRGGEGGQYLVPTPLDPLFTAAHQVTALSAGSSFTCALAKSKAGPVTAYCWGRLIDGRIGDGYTGTNLDASMFAPQPVTQTPAIKGRTLVSLSSGTATSCAIDATGAAICWGSNKNGELGDGDAGSPTPKPPILVKPGGVYSGTGLATASVGGSHVCSIFTPNLGGGVCWGANGSGQLGQGSLAATSSGKPRTIVTPTASPSPSASPSPTGTEVPPAPAPSPAPADGGSTSPLTLVVVGLGGLLVGVLLTVLVGRLRSPSQGAPPRR